MKKIKTAVIGCGGISDRYLTNLKNMFSIIDLVGCYDRHDDRCSAMAEKHGIRMLSMEDILNDPEIELVVNLTQPKSHFDVTSKLLNAGKHVYTEKVLAVSLEEGKALVDLANEKGLYLGAAPDTFLGSAIQTARLAVESGLIGKVTSCVAQLARDDKSFSQMIPFLAEPGGGIGFDVGIYYLTAILSILGPVHKVSGMLKYNHDTCVVTQPLSERFMQEYTLAPETVMVGTLQFDNGVIGTLHFNGECIFPEECSITLYGTEGMLYMPDPNCFGGTVYYRAKGSDEKIPVPTSFGYSQNSRGIGTAEMAWSIRAGRKPRANKEMAYHALDVFHSIVRSCEEDRSQIIESTFEKMPPLPRGHMDGYLDMDSEAALV